MIKMRDSIQHVSESHPLVKMIRDREELEGPYYNHETMGKYPTYQCNRGPCPECKRETCYWIYSYTSVIAQVCTCSYHSFIVTSYSKQTRNLQKIVSWAIPELSSLLEKEIELEQHRRKWFNSHKNKTFSWDNNKYGTVPSNGQVKSVYERYHLKSVYERYHLKSEKAE